MDPKSIKPESGEDPYSYGFSEFQKEIVQELGRIYTALECIATNSSFTLSDKGRVNMRRVQASLQKIRLRLMDHFKGMK